LPWIDVADVNHDRKGGTNPSSGWTGERKLVRTYDGPANLTDATISAVTEAIQQWPELSETPTLYQFVDVERLDGLFKRGATDDSESLPSVEFQFQSCRVTLLCGSSICVIIERYA
jgi:hypothetical protein